jgi:hypothetical protein
MRTVTLGVTGSSQENIRPLLLIDSYLCFSQPTRPPHLLALGCYRGVEVTGKLPDHGPSVKPTRSVGSPFSLPARDAPDIGTSLLPSTHITDFSRDPSSHSRCSITRW